jgi:hypothetical protein
MVFLIFLFLIYIFQKKGNIYIEYNLIKKSGIYKLRVYRNKNLAIRLYKGTEQIAIAKNFIEILPNILRIINDSQ